MKTSNDLKDLRNLLKAGCPQPVPSVSGNGQTGQNRRVRTKEVPVGGQCRKEPDLVIEGFRKGSRVVFMDADLRGTVTGLRGRTATVSTDDGFEISEDIGNLVLTDIREEEMLRNSKVSRKSETSSRHNAARAGNNNRTDGSITVDLHIEAIPGGREVLPENRLSFQMEVFRRILRENMRHRGMKITFVHGVGDGILKSSILKELEEVYALRCSWNPYHSGATTVTIR